MACINAAFLLKALILPAEPKVLCLCKCAEPSSPAVPNDQLVYSSLLSPHYRH